MKANFDQLDDRRRQWANEQIAAHRREIIKLETFLELLDQSVAIVPTAADKPESVNGHSSGEKTMAEHAIEVMRQAAPRVLLAAEIAKRMIANGYVHKAAKPAASTVRAELRRQSKLGKLGIVRTGRGKYVFRESAKTTA